MDLYDAISMRQTIPKVRPEALPRELIERLLNAAAQAPNHLRNRPWRFIVLSGNARVRLGELGAQALARRDPTATEAALESERKKPLRAPVIIAVGIDLVAEVKRMSSPCALVCLKSKKSLLRRTSSGKLFSDAGAGRFAPSGVVRI